MSERHSGNGQHNQHKKQFDRFVEAVGNLEDERLLGRFGAAFQNLMNSPRKPGMSCLSHARRPNGIAAEANAIGTGMPVPLQPDRAGVPVDDAPVAGDGATALPRAS